MSFQKSIDALNKAVNSVFGVDATYTYLSDGSIQTIRGVFDNAFIEINGIASNRPIFRATLKDFDLEPGEGDQIEVNSSTYRVMSQERDAHGSTTLILSRN